MAKKSSGTTKDAATTPKAGKKAGVKKTAVKKAAKPKAETASKSGTPKASTKKSAAPKGATKKAAPKKASAPKLNDRQLELLRRVHGAGANGYTSAKGEDRSLEALGTRKLIKRGAKNKETGKHPYSLTKAGEKLLGSSGASSSPTGGA